MRWRVRRSAPHEKAGDRLPGTGPSNQWKVQGDLWQAWLRHSVVGVDLLMWWTNASNLRGLVGDGRYRERLIALLSQASPRDCAAIGLGCQRRIDRPCREPQTCSRPPVEGPAADAPEFRIGPIPGACSSFVDCWRGTGLHVEFTSDDRHRAVHLKDKTEKVGVWVDGVPLPEDAWLDESGYWVDDRFYVVQAAGPEDHPEQDLAMGHLGCRVLAVVIHDVQQATTRMIVPDATETWTDPCVRLDGGTWRLYADGATAEAGRPARLFPAVPPSV